MNSALMFSKASDEWETPQALFDVLDLEFRFGLDAAATEDNAKCTAFIAKDEDALKEDWLTRKGWSVWLNPPYSRCREFVAKAALEASKGTTVVCLIPSRTDTRWWHEHVWDDEEHEPRPGVQVRFIRGRLKFGDSKNSAPFPSVIVIFRPSDPDAA